MKTPEILDSLLTQIPILLPGASMKLEKPKHEDGIWTLDIAATGVKTVLIIVDWSASTGFGITLNRPDLCYGEGCDVVVKTVDDVLVEIRQMFIEGQKPTYFRTLFRVLAIDESGVWCVLPAWSSSCAIRLNASALSFDNLSVGFRFHGKVRLGATDPDDLHPKEFEA